MEKDYIDTLPFLQSKKIDLAKAALTIASRNHPGRSIARYESHLHEMSRHVSQRWAHYVSNPVEDPLYARVAVLKEVIETGCGYKACSDARNIDNADLIEVIERRRGLPVALGVLYIHAARKQGWHIDALAFPAHFLLRMELEGRRLIFDPFHECAVLGAPELRKLLKSCLGRGAELSATYFETVSDRSVLIRLQNNIKLRLIEAGDYERSLEVVRIMRLIDPLEYRLLLDEAVLLSKTGRPKAAVAPLKNYIASISSRQEKTEAEGFLRQIYQQIDSMI